MKHLLLAFAFFYTSFSFSQCACSGTIYGSANVAGWTLNQTQDITLLYAGERTEILNSVPGATYRISSCTATYDSQLTIYTSSCSLVGFNDDNGPACSASTRASIDVVSPGGNLYVVLNEYNCIANTTSTTVSVTLVSLPCTPTVSLSANTTSICAGGSVTFSTTITNGGSTPSYQWKRNGANVGTNTPTLTTVFVNNNDVFSVVLTSNAPCASPTSVTSNSITMTVSPNVTPTIAISSNQGTTICQGQQVIYSAAITNGGSAPTYQWKRNGNNVGTGLPTYTSSTNNNGDIITCELTSNAPCASTTSVTSNALTMTVTVTAPATISISSNQGTTICQGQSVVYSSTITNGGSTPTYQWKRNGTNVGTGLPTYTSSANANGDVITCELTSDSPCASPASATSNALTMTVNTTAPATITISSNLGTTICQGQQVIYSSTITNGGAAPTYQWKRNGNNVGTGLSTYTSNTNNTGDVITCELVSNSPCASPASATSNSLTMTVGAPVTPTFTQVSPICAGSNLAALPTTSINGISGTWQPAIDNMATTTYSFIPGMGQCGTTASMVITVNSSPTATIVVAGNNLQATSGFVDYAWTLNGNTINGATTSTITPTTNGLYEVSVTNMNGCVGTALFNYTSAGIEDVNNATFNLYPNPSSGAVNLSFSSVQSREIYIYDIAGKLVYQIDVQEQNPTLNLNTLSAGSYHLHVKEGSISSQKVIVLNK